MVLYGGIKANHEEFTFEDAGVLVRALGPSSFNDIMNIYQNSILSGLDKKGKENLKKLTAQYMAQLHKQTSI